MAGPACREVFTPKPGGRRVLRAAARPIPALKRTPDYSRGGKFNKRNISWLLWRVIALMVTLRYTLRRLAGIRVTALGPEGGELPRCAAA